MHSNCDKTIRNFIAYVSKRGKRGETGLGKNRPPPPSQMRLRFKQDPSHGGNQMWGEFWFGQPIGYQNNQNRLRKSGFEKLLHWIRDSKELEKRN